MFAIVGVTCVVLCGLSVAYWVTLACNARIAAAEREAEIVQDYIRNPKAVERRLTRQAIEHLEAKYGVEIFN